MDEQGIKKIVETINYDDLKLFKKEVFVNYQMFAREIEYISGYICKRNLSKSSSGRRIGRSVKG